MGGLYGDAGAIYFATQGMGPGDPATGTQQVGTTSGFTLMGWRVVL